MEPPQFGCRRACALASVEIHCRACRLWGGKQMLQGDKNECAFDTPSEGDGGLRVCPLSCPPFINVMVLITASFIKPLTARLQTCLSAPLWQGKWLPARLRLPTSSDRDIRWKDAGGNLVCYCTIFSFPHNAKEVRSCTVGAGYLLPPPCYNPLRARHQSWWVINDREMEGISPN